MQNIWITGLLIGLQRKVCDAAIIWEFASGSEFSITANVGYDAILSTATSKVCLVVLKVTSHDFNSEFPSLNIEAKFALYTRTVAVDICVSEKLVRLLPVMFSGQTNAYSYFLCPGTRSFPSASSTVENVKHREICAWDILGSILLTHLNHPVPSCTG